MDKTGQDRIGQDRYNGQDRTGIMDRTEQDRTGQDRYHGQDRTGQDRTGQVSWSQFPIP